jgi:hypothetical protein
MLQQVKFKADLLKPSHFHCHVATCSSYDTFVLLLQTTLGHLKFLQRQSHPVHRFLFKIFAFEAIRQRKLHVMLNCSPERYS